MASKIEVGQMDQNGVSLWWEDVEAYFVIISGKAVLSWRKRIEGGDCWIPPLVFKAMEKKAAAILKDRRNRRIKKNNRKKPPAQLLLF